MSSIKQTVDFLNNKYNFKYNELSLKLHWKLKDSKEYIELKDLKFNSIFLECKSIHKGLNKGDFESILYSDICMSYNPFDEYFNNLPKWDGKDYINELN